MLVAARSAADTDEAVREDPALEVRGELPPDEVRQNLIALPSSTVERLEMRAQGPVQNARLGISPGENDRRAGCG